MICRVCMHSFKLKHPPPLIPISIGDNDSRSRRPIHIHRNPCDKLSHSEVVWTRGRCRRPSGVVQRFGPFVPDVPGGASKVELNFSFRARPPVHARLGWGWWTGCDVIVPSYLVDSDCGGCSWCGRLGHSRLADKNWISI